MSQLCTLISFYLLVYKFLFYACLLKFNAKKKYLNWYKILKKFDKFRIFLNKKNFLLLQKSYLLHKNVFVWCNFCLMSLNSLQRSILLYSYKCRIYVEKLLMLIYQHCHYLFPLYWFYIFPCCTRGLFSILDLK